jgi:hypothetical protein
MPTVVLASSLLEQTDGASRIEVAGSTPGEVLRVLELAEPRLKGWVLDDRGTLRQQVNVFVEDRHNGASWVRVAENLPPITSVRVSS